MAMTYDEFLDWADEDTLAEWVGGKVIMTSPANRRHQELVGFLYGLLDAYAKTHDLGIVLPAPFQMHLPTSGREPDVLFVARAHQDRVKTTRIEGPADLVVEVVSPESRGRDRGDPMSEFE
ncbi:MAG TPA: Uma2 family endonuclease, partial [Chloroflexota bacterium]|nr:Uma2 family endonuclease [Chloroflexota bacterium]